MQCAESSVLTALGNGWWKCKVYGILLFPGETLRALCCHFIVAFLNVTCPPGTGCDLTVWLVQACCFFFCSTRPLAFPSISKWLSFSGWFLDFLLYMRREDGSFMKLHDKRVFSSPALQCDVLARTSTQSFDRQASKITQQPCSHRKHSLLSYKNFVFDNCVKVSGLNSWVWAQAATHLSHNNLCFVIPHAVTEQSLCKSALDMTVNISA